MNETRDTRRRLSPEEQHERNNAAKRAYRARKLAENPEAFREKERLRQARAKERDPEKVKAYHREYHKRRASGETTRTPRAPREYKPREYKPRAPRVPRPPKPRCEDDSFNAYLDAPAYHAKTDYRTPCEFAAIKVGVYRGEIVYADFAPGTKKMSDVCVRRGCGQSRCHERHM